MATYRQNDEIIGIAKQVARGTPNETPDIQLWSAGPSTLGANLDKKNIDETHGFPIFQDSFIGVVEAMGDTVHYVRPLSIGLFLNGILGRDTKTGSGDPYTHTIDWGASAPTALPYFTVLISQFGALYQAFSDLRVKHVKIEGASGELLKVTVTWAGGVPIFHTSTSLSASSVETADRMRFSDAHAAIKFAGSALTLPRNFTIDIDSGYEVVPSDSVTPADTVYGAWAASCQLVWAATDFAAFKNTIYGASSPSDSAAATTTPYEPAGSPAGISIVVTRSSDRMLTLLMPRVQVQPFTHSSDPTAGIVVTTVTVDAYGPASGASPVSAVVKNNQSAAY